MKLAANQTGIRKYRVHALFTTIALLLAATPNIAPAKSGGDDESRTEYYGIVQERPETELKGRWVIDGRTFTADAGTEFELSEEGLVVGSCAKVEVRNGRVHEIDSEPKRDCK